MERTTKDYVRELYKLASPLFLYLVLFRRKVQKGYQVGLEMVSADLQRIFEEMRQRASEDHHLETLYKDDESEYLVWKWRPLPD